MEGVRDHIVSNIHGKETHFSMWKVLTELFENSNDHMKLVLKNKLWNIKMHKSDIISQYLTKFMQVRDELGGVGMNVAEDYLVSLALLDLTKRWHIYQDSVNEMEKLLNWEHLWFDLV